MTEASASGHRVVVVGAGISGLAAAYRLQVEARERGLALNLTILEAGPRAGGVIHTVRRDDCLLELGPDCFVSYKPAAVELAKELGIDDGLIGTNPQVRRSFILHRGKLKPLPKGFYLLAPMSVGALLRTPVISWRGKLRMALDLIKPARRAKSDESLADFVRRRFGREALERIAQPMVAGIYTADPEKLSLQATFPQFIEMEREHGSVIRALRRKAKRDGGERPAGPRYSMFVTFREGMQLLPDTLASKLPEDCLRLNTPVSGLSRAGDGWSLQLAEGETIKADAVCLALPANRAGELLSNESPAIGEILGSIPYAGSAVVNLCFNREQIKHALDGIGCVIPAIEKRRVIAFSFSSVKFEGRAPAGKVLVRVFMGGALQPEIAELAEPELIDIAVEELRELVGIEGEPLFAQVARHRGAMAQYHLGHMAKIARVQELAAKLPGLGIAGNGFDGIGIPDCIRNANRAARGIIERLAAAD